MPFFTGNDDLKRAVSGRECLPVAAVSQEDHSVGEGRIELGQGEDRAIAVGRLDHQVECDGLASQILASRKSRFLEDIEERDAFETATPFRRVPWP